MNKNVKLGFVKSKAYGLCGVILTAALLVIMSPNVYADETTTPSAPTTETVVVSAKSIQTRVSFGRNVLSLEKRYG